MDTRQQIYRIICEIAEEFNENLEYKIAVDQGETARLFGKEGVLDSLGLVSFVTAIEQEIGDRFNVELTLADEKAFSQRKSPFRTIGSLTEYVNEMFQGPQ
jgi:D-alanine--poly(phosphoribitol) ligase subunit 2